MAFCSRRQASLCHRCGTLRYDRSIQSSLLELGWTSRDLVDAACYRVAALPNGRRYAAGHRRLQSLLAGMGRRFRKAGAGGFRYATRRRDLDDFQPLWTLRPLVRSFGPRRSARLAHKRRGAVCCHDRRPAACGAGLHTRRRAHRHEVFDGHWRGVEECRSHACRDRVVRSRADGQEHRILPRR